MKSLQLLASLLCASTAVVLAAPKGFDSRPYLSKRHAFRAPGSSHPLVHHKKGPYSSVDAYVEDVEADTDSSNWSGAVITASEGSPITQVQATFTIPTPSVPGGGSPGQYSGVAWVGIDGVGTTGLWQAGAVWNVDNSQGDPVYSYNVWYEWVPNGLTTIDNFTVNAGDTISVNLESTSSTTGQVTISDSNTGQSMTLTGTAPSSDAAISGATAEWITEDLTGGGGLLPFANYGSVTYTDVGYTSTSGSGDATGAAVWDLVDSSGNELSQASIPSGGEVDTTYTGP